MSKRQDKVTRRRIEHAEFLWERAQLQAAAAQSVLEYMVSQYEKHKEELTEEIVQKTEEQISLRQKELETFLMSEKEKYLERIGQK